MHIILFLTYGLHNVMKYFKIKIITLLKDVFLSFDEFYVFEASEYHVLLYVAKSKLMQ